LVVNANAHAVYESGEDCVSRGLAAGGTATLDVTCINENTAFSIAAAVVGDSPTEAELRLGEGEAKVTGFALVNEKRRIQSIQCSASEGGSEGSLSTIACRNGGESGQGESGITSCIAGKSLEHNGIVASEADVRQLSWNVNASHRQKDLRSCRGDSKPRITGARNEEGGSCWRSACASSRIQSGDTPVDGPAINGDNLLRPRNAE
jgi:hypothetical protein